jgi:hypothetical protein
MAAETQKKSVRVGEGGIHQDFQIKYRIFAEFIHATLPTNLTFLDLITAAMHGQGGIHYEYL